MNKELPELIDIEEDYWSYSIPVRYPEKKVRNSVNALNAHVRALTERMDLIDEGNASAHKNFLDRLASVEEQLKRVGSDQLAFLKDLVAAIRKWPNPAPDQPAPECDTCVQDEEERTPSLACKGCEGKAAPTGEAWVLTDPMGAWYELVAYHRKMMGIPDGLPVSEITEIFLRHCTTADLVKEPPLRGEPAKFVYDALVTRAERAEARLKEAVEEAGEWFHGGRAFIIDAGMEREMLVWLARYGQGEKDK